MSVCPLTELDDVVPLCQRRTCACRAEWEDMSGKLGDSFVLVIPVTPCPLLLKRAKDAYARTYAAKGVRLRMLLSMALV